MNLAANDMTFESDPASEAFGLNKDVDAGVIYADNKNSTYSAKDFKGSVDGYQYIDKRIIGGTEYDVIRIASRMPDGQLEYKLLLCSNTAGGSTELTGLGYSIKYVVSIDDTSSSYNRALQDLSLAASNSKDSLEKFMPKRIINVISQDLRFSSVALVHKILQSMSIDAQKYKTLYSVFETYRENFPDKIESLAKYMLASRFTRAMFSQVHGTVFASSKHTTSVAPLTPTTAVTPTEVEAQEYLKRRTIVTKALKGDYNDIDSILNQLTAHGISDAEYNLIYRFGSKKVITSASDISDIIRLMDSNQFIKTLAEQYLTGQKMEDLDPDFLKGLLAAGLISRAKSKMANSASEAAREMNIEHDDFFADKDVPRAFKSADGKESGMPLKLVSAIELRDSLNEINQAFSEETMVDYTPVTMRKLQQELKTEVTFDIGTMGTSRAQFITRLYNRMMTNNPGLHLTENDVRHAFDRLGITLEEGRVLTLDAKNNTGLLQRRMTTGASGTLDTSKDAKRLMQRGQYGDDDISAEGVILKKGDKVVTVHDMFTLFDTEISRLTKSVETHKSSKPSSKRTTPNDVRDREMFKALIVEMAGELPRTQQAALKASFNGITFDIMGAVVAGNGKINGVMAEMFFRNRQNSSSKFLFKSIFSSPEEMGVC